MAGPWIMVTTANLSQPTTLYSGQCPSREIILVGLLPQLPRTRLPLCTQVRFCVLFTVFVAVFAVHRSQRHSSQQMSQSQFSPLFYEPLIFYEPFIKKNVSSSSKCLLFSCIWRYKRWSQELALVESLSCSSGSRVRSPQRLQRIQAHWCQFRYFYFTFSIQF